MDIRPEETGDAGAVRTVNDLAFGSTTEGEIVEALRRSGDLIVSLVAAEANVVVGHIMFSPAAVNGEPGSRPVRAMGLAPMAVRPDRQRRGVGSALVEAGLAACRAAGVEYVFVLGHPEYYPRFGFEPASRHGFRCEYEAPDEAFMVLALSEVPGGSAGGIVRYHPAFGEAG